VQEQAENAIALQIQIQTLNQVEITLNSQITILNNEQQDL
jgi:hypothetical protein